MVDNYGRGNGLDISELIQDFEGKISREQERLDQFYEAFHGNVKKPYIPRVAGDEFRTLLERSKINVIPLVVSAASQCLHVEDYQSKTKANSKLGLSILEKNAWAARQAQLFDAVLTYGYAYTSVLPSAGDAPYIGMHSPRRLFAVYENPAEDEFPVYAFQLDKRGRVLKVYDDYAVYTVRQDRDPDTLESYYTLTNVEEHGAGVCPFQKHTVMSDLEGRAIGEVERVLTLQVRLNQIAFDEMIAISYNSFKVRGISGLVPEFDENGDPIPVDLNAARLITLQSPDSKPWQLDGTDIHQYLDAVDQVIKQIAAVSQTPVHVLQGSLANINAEGLANADSGLMRKVDRYQHSLDESIESMIKLAIAMTGKSDNDDSEIKWRDSEQRTLSNVADALVKLSAGLEVPAEGLWHRIPGVSQGELALWKKLHDEDPQYQFAQMTDEQKMQMPDGKGVSTNDQSGTSSNSNAGSTGSGSNGATARN